MSWEGFYLVCFLVGFFLSLFSFLAGFGVLHLGVHVHGGGEGRNRRSISARSPPSWHGSAAPAIYSPAIPTCGRSWPWEWR